MFYQFESVFILSSFNGSLGFPKTKIPCLHSNFHSQIVLLHRLYQPPSLTRYAQAVPGQMVAKAMLCFNNKIVPFLAVFFFFFFELFLLTSCARAETRLVLGCINGVISDFLFYNRATVRDITYALSAGCGSTGYRENNMFLFTVGDFNVARYIDDETSSASILPSSTGFYALALFTWWWILLL
ncbi:hypothetical protein DKX38_006951 [Salix brachista]|uniref:DUF7731 domain-containing protein n=1 Tax=Salix brachista TaxID=2182728 RepID=A0A5N5MLX0_9ROSI|nr:hypothetical protein DKX38_006951 [Salix brachista]